MIFYVKVDGRHTRRLCAGGFDTDNFSSDIYARVISIQTVKL